MLRHAVAFANGYHGGDAVFAARLDRDEEGRHTVDVFLMPRHDFRYKDGRTQKRASVSKFSKEQARARSGRMTHGRRGRPFKMLGSVSPTGGPALGGTTQTQGDQDCGQAGAGGSRPGPGQERAWTPKKAALAARVLEVGAKKPS